jgi:hypothetical protein
MMKMSMASRPKGLDRGRAGVARSRADDGDVSAAGGEDVIHEPRQELHGHVLEGERGAVE